MTQNLNTNRVNPSITSIEGPLQIRFPFEDFLEKNEKLLPRGVDTEYSDLLHDLKQPWKHPKSIWQAIWSAPQKVIYHVSWEYYSFFGILFFLPFILAMVGFSQIYKAFNVSLVGIVQVSIAGSLGYASAFFYLKFLYISYFRLRNQTKYPWLSENIANDFDKYFSKNQVRSSFKYALLTSLFSIGTLVFYLLFQAKNLSLGMIQYLLALGVVSIILLLPTQVVLIMAIRLIPLNTKLYSKIVTPLLERIRSFLDGYESILSKKNYEVIMILGDSPALSTRELGEVPMYTLALITLTINAFVFTLLSPIMHELLGLKALLYVPINGVAHANSYDVAAPIAASNLLLYILALSIILTFSSTMWPIIKLTYFMFWYKMRVLDELDSFLFGKIMAYASGSLHELEEETLVLFNLRQYVYGLKRSPVDPMRLLQLSSLFLLYIFKGLRGLGS